MNILVLPGLWLPLQKVERVHVAHAVGDQHHGAPIHLVHLLDHLSEGQEVGPVFICRPEPSRGQAGSVLGPGPLANPQARPRTRGCRECWSLSRSRLIPLKVHEERTKRLIFPLGLILYPYQASEGPGMCDREGQGKTGQSWWLPLLHWVTDPQI